MKLYELIRERRKNKGLTQKQLADMVGARQATISEFENNKRSLRSDTLGEMMGILGIKILSVDDYKRKIEIEIE